MVSEEEKLQRELRAVKEVLSVKENMMETGDWDNYNQLQLLECVPHEYQYLDDLERDALERRKELLEQDLRELRELSYDGSEAEFRRHTEYHRGRREKEDE